MVKVLGSLMKLMSMQCYCSVINAFHTFKVYCEVQKCLKPYKSLFSTIVLNDELMNYIKGANQLLW